MKLISLIYLGTFVYIILIPYCFSLLTMRRGGRAGRGGGRSGRENCSSPRSNISTPGGNSSGPSSASTAINLSSDDESHAPSDGASDTQDTSTSSSPLPRPGSSASNPATRKRNHENHTSEMWKHFTKKVIDGVKKAECNYCGTTYLAGGTGNLKNHLIIKHPEKCEQEQQVKVKQTTLEESLGKEKPFKVPQVHNIECHLCFYLAFIVFFSFLTMCPSSCC